MSSSRKIVFMYGGASEEHDISCRSAVYVLKCLNKLGKKVDVLAVNRQGEIFEQNFEKLLEKANAVGPQEGLPIDTSVKGSLDKYSSSKEPITLFPLIHGRTGEDGRIQGLAEFYKWPIVSASCRASSVGMDKEVSKLLASAHGVEVVPYITILRSDWLKNQSTILATVKKKFGATCFMKPARSGSAVGTHLIKNMNEFSTCIEDSFKYGPKVLVEKAITNRRELEVATIGDLDSGIELSEVGEIINDAHEFYDFEAKYSAASKATTAIPAKLDPSLRAKVLDSARKIFEAFELAVYCRIDFFYDGNDHKLYFNEINSIPGMTSISLFPKLFEYSGVSGTSLITKMIDCAERQNPHG